MSDISILNCAPHPVVQDLGHSSIKSRFFTVFAYEKFYRIVALYSKNGVYGNLDSWLDTNIEATINI